jgi:MtN3 and saliva related transmembrane protein
MDLASLIGTAAAISTTLAYLPQIWKIKRQGGQDLSYPMLFVYLFGVVLWLIYGILLHAAAVIWANAATALLVAVTIGLKAFTAREGRARKLRQTSPASSSSD